MKRKDEKLYGEYRTKRVILEMYDEMMMSIGQKTRLFDTISSMAPSTSEQIARAVGLHVLRLRVENW